MKLFVFCALIASSAAAPTLQLTRSNGAACRLSNTGKFTSSCDVAFNGNSIASLASGLASLTARVASLEATDKVHRADIDKKAQKGETGARGQKGQQGVNGYVGKDGQKGSTGATGAKGNTGKTGAKGVRGATGAKGNTGKTGAKGATGAKGNNGAKGEKGHTGWGGICKNGSLIALGARTMVDHCGSCNNGYKLESSGGTVTGSKSAPYCRAYAGSCSNGSLIGQTSRRQDNHCGSCNNGYYLNGRSCSAYGGSCSNGSLAGQSSRRQHNHCGSCNNGYYLNGRSCSAYGGSCSNGSLAGQSSRRQNNHCGSCNGGYYLSNRSCHGYGGSCSNGSLIGQSSRRQNNHCGSCNNGYKIENRNCVPNLGVPSHYECIRGNTLCFRRHGTNNMHAAIDQCKREGARVCEYSDMFELCANGKNPYSHGGNGWYGDHGTHWRGGNWDDEYGTWNRNHCDINNDGPAYHAGERMVYTCCKGGTGGSADKFPSFYRSMFSANKDIGASAMQSNNNAHGAIGRCSSQGGHVCTHNDFMQLAGAGHNPWGGRREGWYGDHGKASRGNWDDEFGTWNNGGYSSNNDGPAHHAGSRSWPYRCCTYPTYTKCPSHYTRAGGRCFRRHGVNDIYGALSQCRREGTRLCHHIDMQSICGHGHNPYSHSNNGWYGDHAFVSNWDDEYGTWNNRNCASNNDGPGYHSNHRFAYTCCVRTMP